MKCTIQWIGLDGKPTPDQNEAVAMAHSHESIWLCPAGCLENRIVGYSEKIAQSFPICADHLARMKPSWKGWSTTPLPKEEAAQMAHIEDERKGEE